MTDVLMLSIFWKFAKVQYTSIMFLLFVYYGFWVALLMMLFCHHLKQGLYILCFMSCLTVCL